MTADFINNMTHELKTPISTVALASNMLRRDKILDNRDKIIHYSGIIHDENDKLQAQVEQVLRIA
ncbi:MAG: two-component sensor histidine kinase, partial [Bacteroidia bacterium]|nr:two-component sensor histidine kinase [Bacteroidia bacterium]